MVSGVSRLKIREYVNKNEDRVAVWLHCGLWGMIGGLIAQYYGGYIACTVEWLLM